jgi:hypothetical protein
MEVTRKVNVVKSVLNALKRPPGPTPAAFIVGIVIFASLSYSLVACQSPTSTVNTTKKGLVPTKPSSAGSMASPTPIVLPPPQDPSTILGVEGNPGIDYVGISWVRLGSLSCGSSNLSGQQLRDTLQAYHRNGIRVLMTMCQNNSKNLADTTEFNDIAQSYPDAVQCGNEEMKQDASVSFLYTPPDKFAQYYDLCERTVHSVDQNIPIVLGSLDPHVAGPDYQLMVGQVNYLDQMQAAMNSTIHPGGNWNWHSQVLGLIDSWHNGYMGSNNLDGVLNFWAQQFHVDPHSGQLGNHLWVVEGTSCFKGCGLYSDTQIAIAHILTLITDVETAIQDHVPFFFFSGKDFIDAGVYWPIGVLDNGGNAKPLRQDLGMGSRTLTLSCPDGSSPVISDQEQLLAKLYSHCSLPSNYVAILSS